MALQYQVFETKGASAEQGLEITGFEGAVSYLVIPGRIDGIPVKKISGHAFAGRNELREVHLPDTIEEIGSYAFYDCENLERFMLSDRVKDYFDGVLRLCRNLKEIRIDILHENYRLLKDILNDRDDKIRMHLVMPNRKEAELLFPEYYDEVHEDTHARAFHNKIVGEGIAYRETVSRKGIDFQGYDKAFSRMIPLASAINLLEEEQYTDADEIAISRLMYPYELQKKEKEIYLEYLQSDARIVLQTLIEREQTEQIRFLLDAGIEIPDDTKDVAIEQASRAGYTEICGILMERFHRKEQKNTDIPVFSLDLF